MGYSFRDGFLMLLNQLGSTVYVYKNFGLPNQITLEINALKNSEKRRPNKVMFQFPERIDISIGDVIQQESSSDLWEVIETEDIIHAGVFSNFKAKVEKMNNILKRDNPSNVIIHGDNYGGLVVSSPNAIQNISIEYKITNSNIDKLNKLSEKLALSDLDREDLQNDFARLSRLSEKNNSPELLNKINERLISIKNWLFKILWDRVYNKNKVLKNIYLKTYI